MDSESRRIGEQESTHDRDTALACFHSRSDTLASTAAVALLVFSCLWASSFRDDGDAESSVSRPANYFDTKKSCQ